LNFLSLDSIPTLTSADPIGRRTSMCDAAGWEAWSYDSRGHVIAERRSTNSVVKSTAYAYNLHGGVTSVTYPSGRTVNYTYNAAGQTLSAADTANSINYASSAAYNPAGALASLQEGANLVSTMYYNNRLQPCRISVKNSGSAPASCADTTTGNVMDLTYGFNYGAADNGNVQSVANNITTARSQSYTYDELNRVSTAKTTATSGIYSWGLQFGYDPWANLLTTSVTQGSAYSLSVYADGSNRIHSTVSTFTYDAAGNLTADPVNSAYTYNAEGELTSAAGVTYTYDGDDNRVQKSNGKLYWYGGTVDPMAESDSSGNLTEEYIFLAGKRIAMLTLSAGTVNYYVSDHLGSSRIVTNSSGTILDDSDFYPYGGERSYSSSSGNNYKFTGKERDTESGLDDFAARFYTSNYGRFLSADDSKFAKPADPQTWNLYTYVSNNPINAVDPTGHFENALSGGHCSSCEMPTLDGDGGPDSASGETADVESFSRGSGPSDTNSGSNDGNTDNPGSDTASAVATVAPPTTPTLNVSLTPGDPNDSGLSFHDNGKIGPGTGEDSWGWNTLLTATLPAGADPSNYEIRQTFTVDTSGKTYDGEPFSNSDKNKEASETLAPSKTCPQCWNTKGNDINAADTPGPKKFVDGKPVESATTTMRFSSFVTDKQGNRVSPTVKWSITIVISDFEMDKNKSSAAVEKQ
jgi:RHS repeat-associated protein